MHFLLDFALNFSVYSWINAGNSLLATCSVAKQAHRDMLTKMPQRSLGIRKVEAEAQTSAMALFEAELATWTQGSPYHRWITIRDDGRAWIHPRDDKRHHGYRVCTAVCLWYPQPGYQSSTGSKTSSSPLKPKGLFRLGDWGDCECDCDIDRRTPFMVFRAPYTICKGPKRDA